MRRPGTCVALVLVASLGSACGGGGSGVDAGPVCEMSLEFATGDDGHAEPLGAGPGEARAGRLRADQVPPPETGLEVWEGGDFVLANDRFALVIEDVDASDLYDPWGGRPVGIALVEGGQLARPAAPGELLILTGRQSVVTTSVSVLNDGSNGQAAVIRASGALSPLPFFEHIVSVLFNRTHEDIPAAIDYVLEPGADAVDIYYVYRSPRVHPAVEYTILHGFMYTPRVGLYAPGHGFDAEGKRLPWLGFVTDEGASWAYAWPEGPLEPGVAQSGFFGVFTDGYTIEPCTETRRHHARVTIGGPGLDGLLVAVARDEGATLRAISGVVRGADGQPAAGVRVHAEAATGEYLTRATSGADGGYTLHVPAGADVRLRAHRRGDGIVGPVDVPANVATADLTFAAVGWLHVVARDADSGVPLPVRVQILPDKGGGVPSLPGHYGEPTPSGGRLHVEFAHTGDATLRAPVGPWRLVVSRGYEYELHDEVVAIAAGETTEVEVTLRRVVDTTGLQCADYHIHTIRSNDSGDDGRLKVRAAVADGLEIPIRSEHEYVEDFQPLIEEMGLEAWAFGVPSVEMTSMEIWGHMGVLPLRPDPNKVNGGAPLWQSFPRHDAPDAPFRTMDPPEVFAAVRARPEQPIIIINHPRGGANYFDYVGYDRATGFVDRPDAWDETFAVVEVFNDSGWLANRDGTVADWLSFLDRGRRVFAVGSSDSHGVRSSPVGYPRTCLRVGTDDPRQLTHELVRDATQAGRSIVSGGIYLDVRAGTAGPGDELEGAPATVNVHVRVQAASWVDVDWLDLVVDGQTVDTIAILPGDANPENPVIRFEADLPVQVAPMGSYVIVAAYGDARLEPVHPGRLPFAVSNPIFLLP